MSAHDEDELKPTFAEGFKLGADKSPEELAKLDANDESLNRWKASLGINAAGGSTGTGPKVTVIGLVLTSPTLPGGRKIEMNLSNPRTEQYKDTPFRIKEGVDYTVTVCFKVNHGIVSGLRYMHYAKAFGVTVDRVEEMLGSFGPKPDGSAYESALPTDKSPEGFGARAPTYHVTSVIVDDDKNEYARFEWCFKLKGEW
ncbi:hypothetical protein FRC01_008335 [Tulasnella sp. 417]|nr:hypothetical protein FRC01_008335 [Tulasnella sp. 417]